METKTIRIHAGAHRRLQSLTTDWGASSIAETIDRLIEEQRRRDVLDRTNAAFAELRRDKAAREAWRDEVAELDGTVADGLTQEPESGSFGSSDAEDNEH
jgi:predicted CopG family antitoxin